MLIKVKFSSNHDDIRRNLPFSPVEMKVLPEMGHYVRLGNHSGRVTNITHCLTGPHDVEIYLSAIN